ARVVLGRLHAPPLAPVARFLDRQGRSPPRHFARTDPRPPHALTAWKRVREKANGIDVQIRGDEPRDELFRRGRHVALEQRASLVAEISNGTDVHGRSSRRRLRSIWPLGSRLWGHSRSAGQLIMVTAPFTVSIVSAFTFVSRPLTSVITVPSIFTVMPLIVMPL